DGNAAGRPQDVDEVVAAAAFHGDIRPLTGGMLGRLTIEGDDDSAGVSDVQINDIREAGAGLVAAHQQGRRDRSALQILQEGPVPAPVPPRRAAAASQGPVKSLCKLANRHGSTSAQVRLESLTGGFGRLESLTWEFLCSHCLRSVTPVAS